MTGKQMIAESAKRALGYTKGGLHEILKFRKTFLAYSIIAFVTIGVSEFLQQYLNYKVQHLYHVSMEIIILCCAAMYYGLSILVNSRNIKIDGKNLFVFLIWILAFFILGLVINPIMKLVISQTTLMLLFDSSYSYRDLEDISAYIVPNLNMIMISIIMVNVAFYPFLLMESSSRPFQENLSIIKGRRFTIILTWLVIWAVFIVTQATLVSIYSYFALGHPYFPIFKYVFSELFTFMHIIGAVLAITCTVVAYLDDYEAEDETDE